MRNDGYNGVCGVRNTLINLRVVGRKNVMGISVSKELKQNLEYHRDVVFKTQQRIRLE